MLEVEHQTELTPNTTEYGARYTGLVDDDSEEDVILPPIADKFHVETEYIEQQEEEFGSVYKLALTGVDRDEFGIN